MNIETTTVLHCWEKASAYWLGDDQSNYMLSSIWIICHASTCSISPQSHCIWLNHDDIMTWNAFGITGPLWEESTGDRRILLTKRPVMRCFGVPFVVEWNILLKKDSGFRWSESPSFQCNVTKTNSKQGKDIFLALIFVLCGFVTPLHLWTESLFYQLTTGCLFGDNP